MSEILVIDLAAVLDKSKVGAEASKHLEQTWSEAQARHQKLQDQTKGAAGPALKAIQKEVADFTRDSLSALEQKRASLRDRLMERARPIVRELAVAKGARMVIERSAVPYLGDDALDLTAQVISRVDALGPLKV